LSFVGWNKSITIIKTGAIGEDFLKKFGFKRNGLYAK
jgi:hypothetical protein